MKKRLSMVIQSIETGRKPNLKQLGDMRAMVVNAEDKIKLVRTLKFCYSQLEEQGCVTVVTDEVENNWDYFEDLSVLAYLLHTCDVTFGENYIKFKPITDD